MIPVVLSGGSGTRLWPLSRSAYPKQFCELMTESLLAQTLRRLSVFGKPWVLTLAEMGHLTRRVFAEESLPTDQIVLEPSARNTAPAIAFLCKVLERKFGPDEVIGVFPADHLIENEAALNEALRLAIHSADAGKITTLGIRPTYPATGFGYIELAKSDDGRIHGVTGFREKPDIKTAEEYVRSGRFMWNAGIFVFKISAMTEAFRRHAPEIWNALQGLKSDFSNAAEVYGRLPSISIDYAVMEKHQNQACVPCDIGWSDLGSWDDVGALIRAGSNRLRNQAQVVAAESKGCLGFASGKKLIAFVGVEDVFAIDTPDTVLIMKEGSSQHVRKVVDQLAAQKHRALREHDFEVRPWGRFEVIRDEEQFKLKKITVDAGAQISYQSHAQRSEHWYIVAGAGEVVLDGKVQPVEKGVSVFIPVGTKHRIRNTGSVPLEFIETQTGSYFGEDDITRFEDDYNRI